MSYYLIVKHDYISTKESSVITSGLFTDKRNALEELEAQAYRAVIAKDGEVHAAKCLKDEKDLIKKGLERKYFITKNAQESPDKLTVWRKYDLVKSAPGTIYGRKVWSESVLEKQFSVSIISVPKSLWGSEPSGPLVVYRPEWSLKAQQHAKTLPNDITEDEYIAKEHRDSSKDYAEYLRTTNVFKALADRLAVPDTESKLPDVVAPFSLPKIRYESNKICTDYNTAHPDKKPQSLEYLSCSLAQKWTPPVEVITPGAPAVPAPIAPSVEGAAEAK